MDTVMLPSMAFVIFRCCCQNPPEKHFHLACGRAQVCFVAAVLRDSQKRSCCDNTRARDDRRCCETCRGAEGHVRRTESLECACTCAVSRVSACAGAVSRVASHVCHRCLCGVSCGVTRDTQRVTCVPVCCWRAVHRWRVTCVCVRWCPAMHVSGRRAKAGL